MIARREFITLLGGATRGACATGGDAGNGEQFLGLPPPLYRLEYFRHCEPGPSWRSPKIHRQVNA
jgi:hypothetical protein